MDVSIDTDDRSRSDAAGSRPAPEPGNAHDEAPDRQPVRRWPWVLLRIAITVQALDAVLQAVFAGRFLSGDFGMLLIHRTNGTQVLLGLCLVELVASVVAWRRGGAPRWVVAVSAVLLAAAGTQVKLGFSRALGVHVPLGVLIIAAVATLAIWVWRNGPASARRSDGQRSEES